MVFCIVLIEKKKKSQSRKKNSIMKYPNFIQFTISDDSRSIFHNQQRKFRLLIRDKYRFHICVTNIKNQRSTRKIRLRENRGCGISGSIYRRFKISRIISCSLFSAKKNSTWPVLSRLACSASFPKLINRDRSRDHPDEFPILVGERDPNSW